jgi:hypothetical protein
MIVKQKSAPLPTFLRQKTDWPWTKDFIGSDAISDPVSTLA